MKKFIWPAMAAALLSLSGPSVKAQTNESLTVTTVSHGVRLTLAVPQQQYPFNSVVRVQVSVQNSSHSPVTVTGFPRNCISENPSVEVLDTSGSVVYPPSPLHFISPPCPTLTPGHEGRVLQPGKSLQVALYALLRGDQIRAAIAILRGQNTYVIKGGIVTVQVRAAESPQAHVLVQTAMPASIDVSTDASVSGPPVYQMSLACPDGNGGETFHQVLFWTRAKTSRFVADCNDPLEWHLIAGWPGHTAIVADYVIPKD